MPGKQGALGLCRPSPPLGGLSPVPRTLLPSGSLPSMPPRLLQGEARPLVLWCVVPHTLPGLDGTWDWLPGGEGTGQPGLGSRPTSPPPAGWPGAEGPFAVLLAVRQVGLQQQLAKCQFPAKPRAERLHAVVHLVFTSRQEDVLF